MNLLNLESETASVAEGNQKIVNVCTLDCKLDSFFCSEFNPCSAFDIKALTLGSISSIKALWYFRTVLSVTSKNTCAICEYTPATARTAYGRTLSLSKTFVILGRSFVPLRKSS